MKSPNENLLTCSDKINGFKKKLELWQPSQQDSLEMYEKTDNITIEYKQIILNLAQYLKLLQQKFYYYFHTNNTNWIQILLTNVEKYT